tara:strand:+ start:474 stop:1187 length:714 start_codon:yes stop_codon:yes gene_type:complete
MHPLRLYTVPCLLIGEIPTFIFTMFDILHLFPDSRDKGRKYPSMQEINTTLEIYTRNLAGILMLSILGMEFFIQTDNVPYDMRDHYVSDELLIWLFQFVQVSLMTEFLFYWLHRYTHYNRTLYYNIHHGHHKWRFNSFAIVNHDLDVSEISIFSLCPALPCILFGVHWKVMLAHAIYTNWQGIYSHSGYHFQLLDYILLTDSRDHDNHHKYPTYNFAGGGWYSIMDRIFGTYYLKHR